MPRPIILVLGGGYSPEREVSLRSSAAVIEALDKAEFPVEFFDTENIREQPDKLVEAAQECDIVFPILHGEGGEDGTVQKILERQGIRYLGSSATASALAFDKIRARRALQDEGILVPRGRLVDLSEAERLAEKYRSFVIKPRSGGSSIDTVISRLDKPADEVIIKELFQKYGKMLIEELIEGTEVTVSILGSIALPPIAIIPPDGEEFDYENKYNGATQEMCPIPPDLLTSEVIKKAAHMAIKINGALGARHLSRVDFIVTPTEELYTLELNTMPGMTAQSLYPRSALAAGFNMPRLMNRFVDLVLRR